MQHYSPCICSSILSVMLVGSYPVRIRPSIWDLVDGRKHLHLLNLFVIRCTKPEAAQESCRTPAAHSCHGRAALRRRYHCSARLLARCRCSAVPACRQTTAACSVLSCPWRRGEIVRWPDAVEGGRQLTGGARSTAVLKTLKPYSSPL